MRPGSVIESTRLAGRAGSARSEAAAERPGPQLPGRRGSSGSRLCTGAVWTLARTHYTSPYPTTRL